MMARSTAGQPVQPKTRGNLIASAFGFFVLGCFVALYLADRDLYLPVLRRWAFQPFRYPFIDIEWFGAVHACLRQGIDVYVSNPCDELGRPFNYSPAWLWMSFWPASRDWTNPLGLLFACLLALSFTMLPRPRQRIDYGPVLLGIVSPMTLYAAERANIDVMIFVSVLSAVWLVERGGWLRLPGYAVILVWGVLKFYPFVAMILALRERLRPAALLSVLTVTVACGFLWIYHAELARIAPNIPQPSIFTASGAVQLPLGFGSLLRYIFTSFGIDSPVAGQLADSRFLVTGIFVALLFWFPMRGGSRLAGRSDLRVALDRLTERERLALVAGAALVFGCFIIGRNSGYRQIHMLLIIPGLVALVRSSPGGALARTCRRAVAAALFLMWFPIPMQWLNDRFRSPADGGSLPTWAFWIGRELIWWWFAAILAGILMRFAAESPMWTAVTRRRVRPGR